MLVVSRTKRDTKPNSTKPIDEHHLPYLPYLIGLNTPFPRQIYTMSTHFSRSAADSGNMA